MRDAFREFRSSAPWLMFVWTMLAVPGMLLIGLVLGDLSFVDTMQLTGVMIGAGIPLLGFIWVRWDPMHVTWRRLAFATIWMFAAAIPGMVIGVALAGLFR